MANHSSPHWQQQRAARKAQPPALLRPAPSGGSGPGAAAAAGSGPGAAAAAGSSSGSSGARDSSGPGGAASATFKRWSNDKFYRLLEQVYPVEEPDPPGLLTSIKLRPYQKQSLVCSPGFLLLPAASYCFLTASCNPATSQSSLAWSSLPVLRRFRGRLGSEVGGSRL